VAACDLCGEDSAVSSVRWLVWEGAEGDQAARVADIEACELCRGGACYCEVGDHCAACIDTGAFHRLEPEEPTLSFCDLHVHECLEQIVDEAFSAGLTRSEIFARLEDYPRRYPAAREDVELMKDHARRVAPDGDSAA
jgi:hypothetical protein